MTGTEGLDSASQGQFTAADLDTYIARGLKYINLYQKWSTPALVALIRSKGLGISPLFESGAERALDGLLAGIADAQFFINAIPTHYGPVAFPASVAVGVAVDFDVTAAQQPGVLNYLTGWKKGLAGSWRLKVYGNGAIGEAAKAAGIADLEWLAGGSGMRGTSAVLKAGTEDEKQDVGDKQGLGGRFSIDTDTALGDDLSWIWWPTGDPRQHPPSILMSMQPAGPQSPAVPQVAFTPPSLVAWQQFLGITADGIYGPETAAAIEHYYVMGAGA